VRSSDVPLTGLLDLILLAIDEEPATDPLAVLSDRNQDKTIRTISYVLHACLNS